MKKIFYIFCILGLATSIGFCQDIITIEQDQVRFNIEGKEVVKVKSNGLLGPAGPPGSIVMWPAEAVPDGYLECNGNTVSRTFYADLFAVIGVMYGSGDGSTTFNLPDLRGYFVRGWNHGAGNDPDAGSRTNRGDSAAGDHVGTKQDDKYRSHNHGYQSLINSSPTGYNNARNYYSGKYVSGYTLNRVSTSSGGNETRPKNISMMFIIKY